MRARLLITGAGSGASANLMQSLRAGDPDFVLVGCHHDRFVLHTAAVDRKYLVPPATDGRFLDALRSVVAAEGIDLVIPNTDLDVKVLSGLRGALAQHLFLPASSVIDLCQDKYALTAALESCGLPVAATYPVPDLDGIEHAFRALRGPRLWCRIRTSSGSMGATSVKTPAQARAWVEYWHEMRGVPVEAFTLSEYLPGRDFTCQTVWKDGTLVLAGSSERLAYFGGWTRASGVSSFSSLAKTVHDPRLPRVCAQAIRALDPEASGVFSVDLKENADGVACITEINAGRFFMLSNFYDAAASHNMAATYVRLALGEPVAVTDPYDIRDDFYVVRDLDTPPVVVHADRLFEGIEDLSSPADTARA
jgi:carbamoyl-phosphate synthase large subunit